MSTKGPILVGGLAAAGVGAYVIWRHGQRQFAQAWADDDMERAWAIADRQMRVRSVGQATALLLVVGILAAAQAGQS